MGYGFIVALWRKAENLMPTEGIPWNGGVSFVSAFWYYAMFCVVVLSGTYYSWTFCNDDDDSYSLWLLNFCFLSLFIYLINIDNCKIVAALYIIEKSSI